MRALVWHRKEHESRILYTRFRGLLLTHIPLLHPRPVRDHPSGELAGDVGVETSRVVVLGEDAGVAVDRQPQPGRLLVGVHHLEDRTTQPPTPHTREWTDTTEECVDATEEKGKGIDTVPREPDCLSLSFNLF